MGLLTDIANDLQMGFGLKDRNKDYYERTAKTIRNSRGDMAADPIWNVWRNLTFQNVVDY